MVQPYQRLTGEQLAGWTPKKTSSPVYEVLCRPNVSIPLPDGTILRGDLYLPRADGSFPTLVAWSPYTKELQNTGLPLPINEVGVTKYLVSCGYCHLIVNARGTGRSAGTRVESFSPCEQKDVADVIEWAAEQPWCNGNIGMVGMSYFAAIQYLAAAQQPAHLKAIFPYLGFTDLYRHFVSRGGTFHSDFFATYYTFVGATQRITVPATVRHTLGYLFNREWLQSLIMRIFFLNRTKMPGRLHPEESWARSFATLAFDEPYDGPFYREKSAWPILDRIQIPVCIGTNWGNPGLHMKGAFQAWHGIHAPKKLFIGPPDPRWPWTNYQDELLAWYDYHLKGIDTGIEEQPPVRYWLQAANQWRSAADWPIPRAIKQRGYLALHADDTLKEQDLQTEPSAQESSLSFVAIPRHMLYPKVLDHYEAQVLRYSTPSFQRDTEVTGPIRLHLNLSSTAIDTHIIARISDSGPDGKRQKLSFGWLEASHRKVDEALSRPDEVIHEHRKAEPLTPGVRVTLDFSLTPTANLFKRGHRLLLEIASQPELLETNAFEGFIFFPYHAPPYPARNTIFHGGSDPSYVEWEERVD
ncbi:MAG TPA: hypothetical protein DDW33_13625 [Ktedonobacter sp.]|jgi:putative CocE/NonD family hydrolase|nr:hypothetical protein [Ktedonobacter sp.]HAT47245.1 hypothetical protein [Ktedonobacter sp.]HBE26716.1 hypothetical protein [Ktedonobacter sp.]HBE27955.1 hypothetical protein [Ktedonobacter sp.]HCF86023.1 hypothetical protein [Ktedonobacter sp.]